MSERRRGLGRGLGALIPPGPARTDASPVVAPTAQPSDASNPAASAATEQATAEPRPHSVVTAASDVVVGERAEPTEAGLSDAVTEAANEAEREHAGAYFAELPVDAIIANPRQPRSVFDEDAMAELVVSLQEVGLLQPVVVRPLAVDDTPGSAGDGPERYELVMGERRWRAAQLAGFTHIPAIVRITTDENLLRDALLENLHRSQLNPLEEAAAYDQLLQDFACTHEELARRIGRSRPQITNTVRLLKLPPLVQRRVAAGVLSAGHARALLSLNDPAAQERLAQRINAEGLSVRAVEEIVALGERPDEPAARRTSKAPVSPRLMELGDRLSDVYETRVRVDLGRRKGKIVMEFASLDDLERILAMLDPKRAQSA